MASTQMLTATDKIPARLGGKLPESSPVLDLLCSACGLPLVEPRQNSDCGCRLCAQCYSILKQSGKSFYSCGKCGHSLSIKQTFRDKAIEHELKRTSFQCFHKKCPWLGDYLCYKEHVASCKFADMKCPNPGCETYAAKDDLESHLKSCPFKAVTCRWCRETILVKLKQHHEQTDCKEYTIVCPAGCEEKFPRKMTGKHLQNDCRKQTRQCLYTRRGCTFKGNFDQLNQHYHSNAWKHTEMLEKAVSNSEEQESSNLSLVVRKKCEDNDQKLIQMRTELISLREEMNRRLNPLSEGLVKMEACLQDFQDSFQELALLVQTLQATSYNGQFVWKIPEVARRRDEAKTGKTISLYSAPFYTSRFGYKLCLRLYMDGDGSGKGTHLSFFLTIMKGEYDALLPWPFNQMVTLMLLDQTIDKNHIVQCFRPEASSSSFWRPHSEMNIASGCPKFAPLSVLYDSNFVKDDTIFFKVAIDTAGLNQH